MKKVLLLLTILFAFATMTFANSKTINVKQSLNKEIKKAATTTIAVQAESCIQQQIITVSYYDPETHELISTETFTNYIVDIPCLLRNGGVIPIE